ncbi:hypothetical protein K501DRAFT_272404 [Backusella circina FSU 941]|nr:hypothetical protein K501DRAFT_272404 [Backusella circina FSU 941]
MIRSISINRDRHNSLHMNSRFSEDENISKVNLDSNDDVPVDNNTSISNIQYIDTKDMNNLVSNLPSHSIDNPGWLSRIKENIIPSRIKCAITIDQPLQSNNSPVSRNASDSVQHGNEDYNGTHLNDAANEKSKFIKEDSGHESNFDIILDDQTSKNSSGNSGYNPVENNLVHRIINSSDTSSYNNNPELFVLNGDRELPNSNLPVTKKASLKEIKENTEDNFDLPSVGAPGSFKEENLKTGRIKDKIGSPISSSQLFDEISQHNTSNLIEVPSDENQENAGFDADEFSDNTNSDLAAKKPDTKDKQGFTSCTSVRDEKPLFNDDKKSLDHKTTVIDINDLSADKLSIVSAKYVPSFVEKRNEDDVYYNAKNDNKVIEPYTNEYLQESVMAGKPSNTTVDKSTNTARTKSNQKYCMSSTSIQNNNITGLDPVTSVNLQNIKPQVSSSSISTKPLNCAEIKMSDVGDTTLKNTLVPESQNNYKDSQSDTSKNIMSMNGDKSYPNNRKSDQILSSILNTTNKNVPMESGLDNSTAGDLKSGISNRQPATNIEPPKILTSSWNPENALGILKMHLSVIHR